MYFFLFYTTINFILGTLSFIGSVFVTQYTFIDDRNYPGGPIAFAYIASFSVKEDQMGRFASVFAIWTTDALLVSGSTCFVRLSPLSNTSLGLGYLVVERFGYI